MPKITPSEKRKGDHRPSKRAKGDSLATIGPSKSAKFTPKSAKKLERRKETKSPLEVKIRKEDDYEDNDDEEEKEPQSQQQQQQQQHQLDNEGDGDTDTAPQNQQDQQTQHQGDGTSTDLADLPKKKGRPPKIDTAVEDTPAKTSAAQDQHPFARSSVIEVWHGVEDPSEDSWWTEDSDSELEESNTISTTKHKFKTKEGKEASIRLCDVIDRVPVGDASSGKWRYYVHYRDFNRRMDEWISMERIVSPPSIGNAKARALKLEEEKQKRKHAKKEEKKEVIDVLAPRASRRRSTSSMANDTPRRRKTMDDDATVVTANSNPTGEDKATDNPPITIAEKVIVPLPTEAVHKTTVGEHVVETIAAQELDEHEGLDEASLREHEEVTKVKNVAFIELGAFQMETWYFSPLPKELLSERGLIEVLYVCEFTLNLFARKSELQRFQARLPVDARHPPGNEIYRNGNLSMFEVDGFEERIYCQNLCYIAKLFLDHKTLYFDVDPFLFYVLCEVDDRGFHPVGYYSKEKYSDVGYNLACILTFPCHQRKGYGRFLIAFSYELSKKEEKVGSPEKPMSDLGQQAYKPYWASTIVDFLLNQAPDASSMSIMDISKITSIMAEDIVFTLNQLGILKIINGVYFIAAEKGLLDTLAKKYPVKDPRVDPSKLHWTPFLTDVKRDKFSIHSKKPSVEGDEMRGSGGFP